MRRLLSAILLVTTVVAGCTSPPPAAKPDSESSESSERTVASPTPLPNVAAPTVNLVQDMRVAPVSAAAHVFLWGHREEADRDLNLAKEAGFTWVKQRFEWRNIEKVRKNEFEALNEKLKSVSE